MEGAPLVRSQRSWVQCSDLELVEGLSAQSEDAYAEIVRRHSSSVARLIRTLLGKQYGCEDVVAEVFEGLWMAPEKFDPTRGTMLAFLRLKARGRSIDIVRSEVRRQVRESNDRDGALGRVSDVDEDRISTESVRAMRAALALLPRSQAAPIYLAFFTGMTYRGVASELGLPEGTVKSRIRSGLIQLRGSEELRSYFEDQGSSRQ
jgi:RNA polymerase sigma-70 factor, ECF subfamily